MRSKRALTILLLGFLSSSQLAVFAQTQAELDQIKSITKRAPTNCSTLVLTASLALTNMDYKKAESCYNKVLDIYKSDPGLGPRSVKYAWVLSRLALCKMRSGQKTESLRLCKEALAIIDSQNVGANASEDTYIITTRENCEQVLGKGSTVEAAPKLPPLQLKSIPLSDIADIKQQEKQTRERLSKVCGRGKTGSAYTRELLYLANIYTLEKKSREAEPLFKEAISRVEKESGKNSPALLSPLSNYGYLLVQLQRHREATALLARMQKIRDQYEASTRTITMSGNERK